MFLAFGVGASLTWYYHEAVFRLLLAPAKGALSPFAGLPIFTSPTEMFGMTISLAMKGGMAVAFPVLVFSAYGLVSPLLNPKQRRFAVLFLPAVFLCYLGGAAFAYFVMLPTGLNFLLHFGTNIAVPVITITEYMRLVTALLFWLGVVFEIPLIMFLLAQLKIVSRKRFKKFRRYVPAAALILSAIITPTFDVVNQTLVAVPIVLLFEAGLLLAWLAEGGPRAMMRKVKAVVIWVLRRPVVAFRAANRRVRRWGTFAKTLWGRWARWISRRVHLR